jgi:hypothetical protein
LQALTPKTQIDYIEIGRKKVKIMKTERNNYVAVIWPVFFKVSKIEKDFFFL